MSTTEPGGMPIATVVGATGKTGRAVAAAAAALGLAVRGTSRRPVVEQGEDGWIDWRVADIATGEGLEQAFAGADAAYLIMPNVHPGETEAIARAARLAREAGVHRIAYHSVLAPDDERMVHHLRKGQAERALREIYPQATLLRPCAYQQNFTAAARAGALRVPYRLDQPFSLVDLDDVAAIAALALAGDERLVGAAVDLGGPADLSIEQLAEQASTVLGGTVIAEQIPLSDWLAGPGAAVSEQERSELVAMFAAYDSSGFVCDPAPLANLLGRRSTSWAEHLARAAAGQTGLRSQ